jgi:pimeloyl-ACP methyl ester carboxylesterase
MFAPWETRFTVVQWDQRSAGRTLRKAGQAVAPTMTLDRMTQDGIELVEYLRKRLGKDKVIVVGHSFGTILDLRMVRGKAQPFLCIGGNGSGRRRDKKLLGGL